MGFLPFLKISAFGKFIRDLANVIIWIWIAESSAPVTLMSGLEAARILNNLTDQTVILSAIVTLHCEADGRPSPTVLWTKNNQTVVEGSGSARSALSAARWLLPCGVGAT